ncbi:DUF4232 domain-containing protein [Paractinoplanes atraurantiacus]|uniref:DUF4232 domain-containing protein n=1 Tax=Paractinoplanes atraurantiacus TaxID=1036182 RepID=A0A285GXN2_9ACTN|nr:DUF4232 domain-containing protein [Actinoplanes atraurantiacus]SNY28410.1 Protein of unknown function [Actinoplanes atraurantiacus]
MRRTIIAVGAGLVLAAGGCASSNGDSGAAPATTPPATATTTPDTAGATVAPTPSATRTMTTSVKSCLSKNLEVTVVADAGGGSAGHTTENIVFANKSGLACTLYGYPGVSFVAGDQGKQVGSAFTRTPGEKRKVTLEPGDKVRAAIQIANYQNVDAASCKPVQVRGLRVYPPNETAAVFVAQPQTACSAPNQAAGQVQPVTAE